MAEEAAATATTTKEIVGFSIAFFSSFIRSAPSIQINWTEEKSGGNFAIQFQIDRFATHSFNRENKETVILCRFFRRRRGLFFVFSFIRFRCFRQNWTNQFHFVSSFSACRSIKMDEI